MVSRELIDQRSSTMTKSSKPKSSSNLHVGQASSLPFKSPTTLSSSNDSTPMSTPLHLDDADRYSRLRLIRWWDQDRLRAAKILVVGAGAIGNEVLKNLALLGIGHSWIVDFDTIDDSNLTRSVLFRESDRGQSKARVAARAMREINPGIHVHAIHGNVLTDV